MIRKIWKFRLLLSEWQKIEMPVDAQILCVRMQGPSAYLWALCDPAKERTMRTIGVFGTGGDIDWHPFMVYIDTYFHTVADEVHHVFELK